MQSEPAASDELVSAALNASSNLRSQTEATRECASVVERFYEFRKWVIDEGLFDSPYFAMQTFFGSVKNRNASSPPSRPTPGISLLPRVRGPIPERIKSSPTRFACG